MKTSRLMAIVLIVVLASAVINWVRTDATPWHIVQAMPLLGGYRPGVYDLAGAVMLLIMAWGLWRLRGRI